MNHFRHYYWTLVVPVVVLGSADLALGNPIGPLPSSLLPARRRVSKPVVEVLQSVRDAMARRDLLQAASILADARRAYREPDDALEIERMWLGYRFLLRFWSAVRAGRDDLQPGSQLELSDSRPRVLRVDLRQVVVQRPDNAEQEISLVRTRMEPGIAVALARTQLVKLGGVGSQLLAAFHFLDGQGDKQQARSQCEELYARGHSVEVWLPEL